MPSVSAPELSAANAPALTPRAFFPLAATMLAVFGAMVAQQVVIDAAEKWRNR